MGNIQKQLKREAQKLARLQNNLMQQREQKRKQDTRRKIELGGLIIKAKLDTLSKAQILGLLIEAKEQINGLDRSQNLEKWEQIGDVAFQESWHMKIDNKV